jgi:hypothetical protein
VNLLDENIRDDQRARLRKGRVPFRQIGKEISSNGIADENIIPLLHEFHRVTFFTQDRDFLNKDLCHDAYALVFLDVNAASVAEFIRRFLKHPRFNTQTKRMGLVVRIHPDGMEYWNKGRRRSQFLEWEPSA